ncbi:LysR family transcriptional regulator [Paenibacillus radicis (ex Xue et al. 2023)]|uniref:LysR family transcriptional regulator n=1 Tax=Paenibacillus radicis (ex Xue et al. 2023) TaxID=2972489 RepID=A0ABT1YB57_9BACL|nr:LysR family transcriptional regulator [Paenibacillus radicis (ex Xue et al. 2023)]MCR8630427.1 LysR family transcriptional regulator [Paenibacillus radicis (ex Xue et al. 2023)]
MELRQLEYFMAVCKELHFTRASEKLGVTQPTLSHQIKALEIEIGMPLFDRIGKKTALTEAGEILLKHSNQVFNSLQNAQEEIEELQEVKCGRLSIGVLTGELNQLVSKVLFTFHKNYPYVQIAVVGRDDVTEGIIRNEIDLGLTIIPIHDERITTELLYEEDLYLTVSNNHPLAAKKTIDLEQVKDQHFILFPEKYQCRQQINAAFKTIEAQINPIIETDATESILTLVQAQAGVSILSKTLLTLWTNDNIRMIKLEKPPVRRQIGLAYHKEKYIGFAAQKFIGLLRETIADQQLD